MLSSIKVLFELFKLFFFTAHQVYGSQNDHDVVRKNCMNYIVSF